MSILISLVLMILGNSQVMAMKRGYSPSLEEPSCKRVAIGSDEGGASNIEHNIVPLNTVTAATPITSMSVNTGPNLPSQPSSVKTQGNSNVISASPNSDRDSATSPISSGTRSFSVKKPQKDIWGPEGDFPVYDLITLCPLTGALKQDSKSIEAIMPPNASITSAAYDDEYQSMPEDELINRLKTLCSMHCIRGFSSTKRTICSACDEFAQIYPQLFEKGLKFLNVLRYLSDLQKLSYLSEINLKFEVDSCRENVVEELWFVQHTREAQKKVAALNAFLYLPTYVNHVLHLKSSGQRQKWLQFGALKRTFREADQLSEFPKHLMPDFWTRADIEIFYNNLDQWSEDCGKLIDNVRSCRDVLRQNKKLLQKLYDRAVYETELNAEPIETLKKECVKLDLDLMEAIAAKDAVNDNLKIAAATEVPLSLQYLALEGLERIGAWPYPKPKALSDAVPRLREQSSELTSRISTLSSQKDRYQERLERGKEALYRAQHMILVSWPAMQELMGIEDFDTLSLEALFDLYVESNRVLAEQSITSHLGPERTVKGKIYTAIGSWRRKEAQNRVV
jgi:uncharacterized protein YukE